MSTGKGCACCTTKQSGTVVVGIAIFLAAAALIYVAFVVVCGVFSVHGLAYSFGLAGAGTLRFAPLVRVTTFVLLTEFAAAVSLALDYLDGRRYLRFRWAWIIAHVTLARRIVFAAVWLVVSAVTLVRDVAAYRRLHVVRRDVGLRGLGYRLAALLAELRTAGAALVRPGARRRPVSTMPLELDSAADEKVLVGVVLPERDRDAALCPRHPTETTRGALTLRHHGPPRTRFPATTAPGRSVMAAA